MNPSNPLLVDIKDQYLSCETKCAILNGIWGTNYNPEELAGQRLGESYLHFYEEQCRNALHSAELEPFIRTHNNLIEIVRHLQEHPTSLRQDVGLQLHYALAKSQSDAEENCFDDALDLAARLLSMTAIGKLKHSFIPGQKPMIWRSGPLKALLEERFQVPASTRSPIIRVKLDRLFIARNLERIAGLKIVWTDNLSDHLRLMRDDTEVVIYHHASFLVHQKKSPIFPEGFIEETIQTFCLLFPQYDRASRKWFRAQQARFGLDDKAGACGHLSTEERQIDNFVFWHDRIGILKQAFDEAEPSTIAQWWFDQRRRVQWYTFWVAALVLALTIFFGAIQCIEGGLQVYKAYYPS